MTEGLQLKVTPIDGRFVSCTVMVWLHVLLLLQVSIAAQVRVTEKLFPHRGFVTVLRIMMWLVPHESAGALAGSKVQALPRLTVRGRPHRMAGPVVSAVQV